VLVVAKSANDGALLERVGVPRLHFFNAVAPNLAVMTLDVTHLMRLDRESPLLPDSEPAGFAFRFLAPDEVRNFAEPQNELTTKFANRVENGRDFCFAALSGDRLAGYAWYAIGSIKAEHNRGKNLNSGVAMSLPDGMAFMYKGFVHPKFRGAGLYGYINAKALQRLETCGVTTMISTADWTNWAALNCCWRLGYQDLGLVWRVGWGRVMLTRAPSKGKTVGIRFAGDALVHPRTEKTIQFAVS
jgi:hypothetical protein